MADNIDVSGCYRGTYTASKEPEELNVVLMFSQTDTVVQGAYITSSRVFGHGHGTLEGNVVTMSWYNAPNSGCPGVYRGSYTFECATVTFTYDGVDCLGKETGSGKATRIDGFSRC